MVGFDSVVCILLGVMPGGRDELVELRGETLHPPVDGDVIDVHSPLGQ